MEGGEREGREAKRDNNVDRRTQMHGQIGIDRIGGLIRRMRQRERRHRLTNQLRSVEQDDRGK